MARAAMNGSPEKAPVYQVLADDIKAIGVEAVFGLMSDDTALFATALDTAGVRFYGARHENAAIAMADGYAYATGRLGVAVIGRGPALPMACIPPSMPAALARPVLIIYGEAATIGEPNGLGPDYKATRRRRRAAGRPACAPSRRQPGWRRQCWPMPRQRRSRAVPSACTCRPTCSSPTSSSRRTPLHVISQRRKLQPPSDAASDRGGSRRARRQQAPLIVAGLGAHRAGARERHRGAGRAHRRPARHHGAGQRSVPRQSRATSASSARSRTRSRVAWPTRPTACWCSAPVSISSPPALAPRCRTCR